MSLIQVGWEEGAAAVLAAVQEAFDLHEYEPFRPSEPDSAPNNHS